jgi:putative transposase
MQERFVDVDHAILNRWVIKFSPLITARTLAKTHPRAILWRVDETYIKVKGEWMYHYRAEDCDGQKLDFMPSERHNKPAARRCFRRAIDNNGMPDRIVIDKSGASLAGLEAVSLVLKFT